MPEETGAADESLKKCQHMGAFSPSATMTCVKNGTFHNNVTVKILAVRCNGDAECANGEDEENCTLPFYILMGAILSGGILAIISSSLGSKSADTVILDDESSANIEVSESKEEEATNLILAQQADVEVRKSHSKKYYNLTMEETNHNIPEAVNVIKVSTTTSTKCSFKKGFLQNKKNK